MSLYISRVQIKNFRNFQKLDVYLSEKAVIVGENKSGKTNFIHALRLILDPDLPDSARHLKAEDFWDGLESPMEKGEEISISIDLQGFSDKKPLLSILSDYLIKEDQAPTARITYKYSPLPDLEGTKDAKQEIKYDFIIYGGDDPANVFGYQQRKWMPLQVLPALRDAEKDLENWRRSPLRPLIDRLKVTREDLSSAADKIKEATGEINNLSNIKSLSEDIERRLEEMIGEFYSVSPSLGVASTDALRLLRSLRLYVDGERQRTIGDTSLGICNILYLTLLVLELERKEAAEERASTILAIEEPEAHLHPHIQRLVYRDFLRRESSVILTTHSPHIVSVSPISMIALIRNCGIKNGSKAFSTVKADFTKEQIEDLERYIDATRGEIVFAQGVVLVEGDAELYTVSAFANTLRHFLDKRGISVCSVHGTDFMPYIRLLGSKALEIPFVVITDGDPYNSEDEILYRGLKRGIKSLSLEQPDLVTELDVLLEKKDWKELRKRMGELGVYVGQHTLEIDLVECGYNEEMLTTLKELGAGPKRMERFKDALENLKNPTADNIPYILKSIEIYGKGRYAQRLAPKLKAANIPAYIKGAIEHIVNLPGK